MKAFKDFIKEDDQGDYQFLKLDVPTFIKLMELSREDLKDDESIHYITEELMKIKGIIDMHIYEKIVNKLGY